MNSLAAAPLRALVLPFALVSCMATVPKASMEEDTHAKLYQTRPDRCGLYIYRNENFGGSDTMVVELDGSPLGKTAAKTFLFVWVMPGKHKIISRAEYDSTLEFEAKNGKLVFIWQEAKMGFLSAGCRLHLVGEGEGKKGVHECELAEVTP